MSEARTVVRRGAPSRGQHRRKGGGVRGGQRVPAGSSDAQPEAQSVRPSRHSEPAETQTPGKRLGAARPRHWRWTGGAERRPEGSRLCPPGRRQSPARERTAAASRRAPNTRTTVCGVLAPSSFVPQAGPKADPVGTWRCAVGAGGQTPTTSPSVWPGDGKHRGRREKPMSYPLVAGGGDRVVAGDRGPEQQGRLDTRDPSPCSHPARKLVPSALKPQRGEATKPWDNHPEKSGMKPKQEPFPTRGPKSTNAQTGPASPLTVTGTCAHRPRRSGGRGASPGAPL